MFRKVKIRSIYIVASLLCIALNGFAKNSSTEEIYTEAIDLFEKADALHAVSPDSAQFYYQKSVHRFEFLIEKEGVKNGWLYYNLGNAYFRMQEIGLALYNYRMAQQYMPHNNEVKHNLEFTQSLVKDVTESNTLSRYKQSKAYIKAIPSLFKALFFIPLYTLMLLLTITPLRVHFPKFYRWIAIGLLLPITILIGLSSIEDTKGIIVKDKVLVKKGNSLVYDDALMSGLNQGTEFTLLEQRNNWLKIQLQDGKEAWITNDAARIID